MFKLPQYTGNKTLPKKNTLFSWGKNPYVFLGATAIIVVTTLLLYTLPNIKKINEVKEEIGIVEAKNIELDSKIIEAEGEQKKILQKLHLYQDKHRPRLERAFPFQEDIGELTRFLENFSLQLEKQGSINLNTIAYGQAKYFEEYSILPIRLSFEASNINFVKFMQMIKSSGSIQEKDFYEGKPVRLMQVDRITVSIPRFDELSGGEQLYSINLQLSAFFRTQETKS